jgi:hypothetical protein
MGLKAHASTVVTHFYFIHKASRASLGRTGRVPSPHKQVPLSSVLPQVAAGETHEDVLQAGLARGQVQQL